MKSVDVCGVCNSLVDIFADISNEDLTRLGFEKGTMRLVDASDQIAILDEIGGKRAGMQSGGSVANSLIAVAQLGGKSAMLCQLAQDEYGRFFLAECEAMGIIMPVPLAAAGS